MAAAPVIAAIGVGLSAIGTGVGVVGSLQAAAAAKKEAKARARAAKLAAMRERRQAIAAAQKVRAQQLSIITNQGATGSSSASGAIAGTQGQLGNFLQGSSQNQATSQGIFKAQKAGFAAGTVSSVGAGIGSLGGAFQNVSQNV